MFVVHRWSPLNYLLRLSLPSMAPLLAVCSAVIPLVAFDFSRLLSGSFWFPHYIFLQRVSYSPMPWHTMAFDIFLHNCLVAGGVIYLLFRISPLAPRLFVLLWAIRIGLLASPAGLLNGGWYLLWSFPVIAGEFWVYGSWAAILEQRAYTWAKTAWLAAALLLLALYEAYIIAFIL